MLLRLLTLGLAQAFDYATFGVMIRRSGPSSEANPIVAGLFEALGEPALAATKVALVVLVGCLVVMAAGRTERLWAMVGGLPLALGIAVGLIGGITNSAVILS